MIYVLLSASLEKGSKGLIKIGYTNNWDKRLVQYKLHNPSIVVLYLVEDGDEETEYSLHDYFKKYKIDQGKEWYNYDEEIIKFFESNRTIDSIKSAIPKYTSPTKISKDLAKERIEILLYISRVSDVIFPDDIKSRVDFIDTFRSSEYLTNNGIKDVESLFNHINQTYNLSLDYKDFDRTPSKEIEEFLKTYKKQSTTYDKLKYLCENYPKIENILDYITEKRFKEYITILGIDRCRALGYNITKINKEFEIVIFNNNLLNDEIYKQFSVGDNLTREDIKNKLTKIYSKVNYNKTPKATDLEEWFELKNTLISNGSCKRDRGFKLIKRKK